MNIEDISLKEMMDVLDQQEQQIVILRLGLRTGKSKTFNQVGQDIGLTPNEVQQKCDSAFTKVRRLIHQKSLTYGS